MIPNPAYIHDALATVMERGAAVLPFRRTIWALGGKNDKPAVWSRLLDTWEEMDNERSTLSGVVVGSEIVLMRLQPDSQVRHVTEWAKND